MMKLFNWLKNHKFAIIIISVLLIWSCEKLWSSMGSSMMAPPQVAYVETVVLKPRVAMQSWQAVGTVKAVQNITVDSEVSGVIQNIDTPSSQSVQQGNVLLTIKHDDITANLQKDQAILTQKQVYYQRLMRLINTNAVSKEDISKALSEFQQGQAAVALDQAQLNKYIIKAPFSGVIGIWRVNIGQLVKAGDHLVTLTQLSPVQIDFMLPVSVLGNIHVGDEVQFTTKNYGNRIWRCKVVAVDPQLDSVTHNIQLRAQVDNKDGKLVPYLYGQVTVNKGHDSQLLIPQEAVIYDPKGTSVYLLQKNKVHPQAVTLGEHQGDEIIVESGLKAGDEVVTAGMMKLFPGMSVVVNKRILQESPSTQTTS